jgi:hypothetical protein
MLGVHFKKSVDLPLPPRSHQGPQLAGQLNYQHAGVKHPLPVRLIACGCGSIRTLEATLGHQAVQPLQDIKIR